LNRSLRFSLITVLFVGSEHDSESSSHADSDDNSDDNESGSWDSEYMMDSEMEDDLNDEFGTVDDQSEFNGEDYCYTDILQCFRDDVTRLKMKNYFAWLYNSSNSFRDSEWSIEAYKLHPLLEGSASAR
jgi:hypothetical protein